MKGVVVRSAKSLGISARDLPPEGAHIFGSNTYSSVLDKITLIQ